MLKHSLYRGVTRPMTSKRGFGLLSRLPALLAFVVAMAVPAHAWADDHEFMNPSMEPDMVCHRIQIPLDYCKMWSDNMDADIESDEMWMLFPCNGYVCGHPDDIWFPMPIDPYWRR